MSVPHHFAITSPVEYAVLAGVGLAAGLVGGLVGIGGSVIMIPAMIILLGPHQHMYQASAMVVNVAVALPAAARHKAAGALRMDVFRVMLPVTLVAIVAGVLLSNRFEQRTLQTVFGIFLVFVAADSSIKALRRPESESAAPPKVSWFRSGTVGTAMGFFGGLLGVGGGAIAVPLAQMIMKLPIRNAIAASASVMAITAGIGAAIKISTLGEHGEAWQNAIILALILAPSSMLGGHFGAGLTHTLPTRAVRIVFAVVMIAAAVRLVLSG